MLCHAGEYLVYLVRSGIGRDVDFKIDINSRTLNRLSGWLTTISVRRSPGSAGVAVRV
jgi:hypothetical protein